jgi:hypothetical protein
MSFVLEMKTLCSAEYISQVNSDHLHSVTNKGLLCAYVCTHCTKLGNTIHGPLCRRTENEKAYKFLSGKYDRKCIFCNEM